MSAPPAARVPEPASDADRPLRVSELAEKLESVVRDGLPQKIRVVGEVSGSVQRTHWYFNAKDEAAVIACVMFASAAKRAGVTPENGRAYVLTGRVEYYAKGGKISLIVDRIDPVGEGALDLAFRRLCDELRTLGWFDTDRKRPLPTFPRRVAVVTSAGGAALQDVLNTMSRRCPAVDIAIIDVRVQGDRAAEEVARAIRAVGRHHASLGIDAVIVTRGGGSKEDLWSFNERIVAEAIVRSPIPVVAAIGHETDTTIAELVADERAATPTQAAMRLTPDRAELARQVSAAHARLRLSVNRAIRHERQRLHAAARHPLFRDPAWTLARARSALRHAASDLAASLTGRVESARRRTERIALLLERAAPAATMAMSAAALRSATSRLSAALLTSMREHALHLDATQRHLESVGPRSVLGRGYSWTRTSGGRLVRSVTDVRPGDTLRTQVIDGQIDSVVGSHASGDLRDRMVPPPVTRTRPRTRVQDASQLGLFPGTPPP